MKKLGLALGSGGARGVAHIGFLQALEEAGIRPSCITGCSMGAIVGALYCSGVSLEKIREHSTRLRLLHIASLNINPIRSNGVFQFNKARKLMTDYIGDKTFGELEIPFCCVATDLVEGKLQRFTEGSVVEAALASSAIPGIFTPIGIDGRQYIDGGVLERVPTEELKDMGAEVVVAVDVLGDLTVKNVSFTLIDTVLRCIDIMDTRQTQRKKKARKNSVDLWLEPDLGGMDQYKVKKSHMEFAYDKGYQLGKENVERILSLLE